MWNQWLWGLGSLPHCMDEGGAGKYRVSGWGGELLAPDKPSLEPTCACGWYGLGTARDADQRLARLRSHDE